MPTPRFEITDRVQLFSGETGQVVDILEFDDRRNGYKYLVARGPSDRGQVWHEALMEGSGGHTPNRALNRAQLETIAWQVTPERDRRGSGSRRAVLVDTKDGLTALPLSELTDNQIRKYIGPQALEEGGDMRKNGSRRIDPTLDVSGARFSKGDRVTDRGGAMTGTVIYGSANGPFAESPFGYLVLEDSDTEYRERNWEEGRLRPLTDGRPARRPERDSAGRKVEYNENASSEDSLVRFQVGDRVCFVDSDPRHHDKVGEITRVGNYSGEFSRHQTRYWIRADNGSEFTSGDKRLRLATGHSRNGARAEPDETAARELSLYIENEYDLVGAPNSQGKAIEKDLLQKIRKGSFDLARSEDVWMHLMEAGAKKYAKEYASPKDWSVMFNKATRELVAHEFATTFYEENKGSR